MANRTQDEVLKRFEEASWRQNVGNGPVEHSFQTTDRALEMHTAIIGSGVGVAASTASADTGNESAATPTGQNVQGGAKTERQADGDGSVLGNIAKDMFEGGLGLVPLISGLFGLFGGSSEEQPPLLKYEMPSSISFMSADTGHGLSAADFDDFGSARAYESAAEAGSGASSPNGGAPGSGDVNAGQATDGRATPQITVNVQAMDAQSFLDRSSDIAQAVRSAMLNLSSINDVVNEL
jgi:hypothetical protein